MPKIRTSKSLNDLAREYDVHPHTFSSWLEKNEQLMDELTENNWSRRQLFTPLQVQIVYKYLGNTNHT